MNPFIDEQPAVLEVEARAAQAREEWQSYMAARADLEREHQAELAEWEQAVADFGRGGNSVPPGPRPEPAIPHDAHLTRLTERRNIEEGLTAARVRAVAAAGDEIIPAARADLAEALAEAAPHIAALTQITERVRVAQKAEYEVFVAREVRSSSRPSEPLQAPSASITDVVDAVTRQVDLMPRRVGRVMVDRDVTVTGRVLGLQQSNLNRQPETAWEPPTLPEPPRVDGLRRRLRRF